MRVGADLIQGEGWEQGLAQGKSSRAVAALIQDVREDFLLHHQGPGSSPHELHLLQIQREQSDGPGATGLPGSPPQTPPESHGSLHPAPLSVVHGQVSLCCLLLKIPPDLPKPQGVARSPHPSSRKDSARTCQPYSF